MKTPINEQFQKDGFVFPVDVVDDTEARQWRTRFEHCERLCEEHEHTKALKGFVHLAFPEFYAMIGDPRIVEPVAEILGPDVLCWNTSFFLKEPQTDSYVSWHQDLNYWGLNDVEEVTAWVALSPATSESGCMRFIRGSHHHSVEHEDTFAEHNLLTRGQEVKVEIDESAAVDIALQPGQMSLHHGLLMHASGPNSTDDRRIGFAIRYITPRMKQLEGDRDYAVLVRGEDRFGNFVLADPPEHELDPAAVERVLDVAGIHQKILYRKENRPRRADG